APARKSPASRPGLVLAEPALPQNAPRSTRRQGALAKPSGGAVLRALHGEGRPASLVAGVIEGRDAHFGIGPCAGGLVEAQIPGATARMRGRLANHADRHRRRAIELGHLDLGAFGELEVVHGARRALRVKIELLLLWRRRQGAEACCNGATEQCKSEPRFHDLLLLHDFWWVPMLAH